MQNIGVKQNLSGDMSKYIRQTLISTAFCGVVLIVSALLLSLAVCNFDLPDMVINVLAILSSCMGGLAGGYINGRLIKQKGLLVGAVCGIILALVLFLFKAAFESPVPSSFTMIKMSGIILCSAFGGILGVNKRSKVIRSRDYKLKM